MKELAFFLRAAVFVVFALILQRLLPGTDVLAVGFIAALQSKKWKHILWLFLLCVLIQEGTGTLSFGTALLWYAGIALFFILTSRIFVANNLPFILVLSAAVGIYRSGLLLFMCAVQNVPADYTRLVQESLLQAALIPVVWLVVRLLRPDDGARHAH